MAIYLGIVNDGTFVSSDGYSLRDSNNISLYAEQASDRWKVILNGVAYRVKVNLDTKESE
jgi:hypothetical protein